MLYLIVVPFLTVNVLRSERGAAELCRRRRGAGRLEGDLGHLRRAQRARRGGRRPDGQLPRAALQPADAGLHPRRRDRPGAQAEAALLDAGDGPLRRPRPAPLLPPLVLDRRRPGAARGARPGEPAARPGGAGDRRASPIVLALVATFSFGGAGSGTSPIVERAQLAQPDRRRPQPRRPLPQRRAQERDRQPGRTPSGPGSASGVPWRIHYPTAEDLDRRYTHLAPLAYWLDFGPLGLVAYVALFGSFLWVSFGVCRRHLDPIVRICALAIFGAILALIVVELTATFTGVDPRISIVLGAALGWLSVAWRQLPERDRREAPRPVLARTKLTSTARAS